MRSFLRSDGKNSLNDFSNHPNCYPNCPNSSFRSTTLCSAWKNWHNFRYESRNCAWDPNLKTLFETDIVVTIPTLVSIVLRLKNPIFPFQDNVRVFSYSLGNLP
jgi:hypothetical protein